MRQFGFKEPGKDYIERPTASIILFDGNGRVLIVKHLDKYFLPGGGMEHGESAEVAIHREVKEEIGWSVKIGAKIATAGEYLHARNEESYFNKIGHFYVGEIVDDTGSGSETDHEPMWVTIDEFETGAARESHVWAVRSAVAVRSESKKE